MFEKDISKKIAEALLSACKKYFKEHLPEDTNFPENVEVLFQVTRDHKFGDLTSNAPMQLARYAKKSPGEIGKEVVDNFRAILEGTELGKFIGDVNLTGGFINLRFAREYYSRLLLSIYREKCNFGRSSDGGGKKINLEFVSANPTGPLTIAHGRQAAIGDALARILRFNGFSVTNEYYLNDYGRQINLLGKSVKTRYLNLFGKNESLPEDGYMGDYIIDIAKQIKAEKGEKLLAQDKNTDEFFSKYAVKYIMKLITEDLSDFGVKFDVWTSQKSIEKCQGVEKVLKLLKNKGYIYEEDGAVWFASTRLGDDKDRVVTKSDGTYTYLAPDVAYHKDKYERGYSRLIDLLGPDHHGYIKRMTAAVEALGHNAASLDILIVQLVTLTRGGKNVSMSTRKGEFISLREIIDEIGKDVTRFFFLSRRLDSHLDLDIDLAKKESADNPVFYIQYAHARICSIKKFGRFQRACLFFQKLNLDLLVSKEEKKLMRKLNEFPFASKTSADTLEPNRVIVYLNELARCFHSFYTECRVIGDDNALSKARLHLVECVRIVLANGLDLLNITLPKKM
ncbi:MAG: arginine--tRNA ligase [Candidatus Omnitrophica bacterium]|nr:arginine--tRNA ligase [Candidatus Omnitrophota bacterium]